MIGEPKRTVSIAQIHFENINDHEPYLPLLLLADPSEKLVRDYVKTGICVGAVLNEDIFGVYVLLDHGEGLMELKNIAVAETLQGQGFGKQLLEHAIETARRAGAGALEVGTGNSSLAQLRFYEKAGFQRHRVDEGFFLRNYEQPIFENGMQCTDMIFLIRDL